MTSELYMQKERDAYKKICSLYKAIEMLGTPDVEVYSLRKFGDAYLEILVSDYMSMLDEIQSGNLTFKYESKVREYDPEDPGSEC